MLRKDRFSIVKVLFVSLLFALSATAQPANDNFADAQEIVVDHPLPVTITGNTAGATVESEETSLDPTLAASVWFKVTAPVDGVVQIDTEGSDFDTRLAVVVGSSYASLTLITADNEPANGTAVILEVEQNVEYHIAVFGFNGQTGNLSLNLRETEGASISGHVTAALGGAALGQITVQALAYNSVFAKWTVVAETTTHDLGGYTLGNLQIGTNYRLRAIAPSGDHAPVCYTTATFVEDAQTAVPNADLFGIDMAMPNAATISGVVRDSGATGLGDITARAYVWNATSGQWELVSTTTSASDGSFTLSGLPAGTVRMGFEDETTHLHLPSFYNGSNDLASAQDIAVGAGANLTGYAITLPTAGSIQGTATQRFTNLPLPGIRVQALRFNASSSDWELTGAGAITAGDGTYTLTGLAYETYKVVFADLEPGTFSPVLFGGSTDPDTATAVVLSSGTPAAASIDQSLERVRITNFTPGSGGQFALDFLGNRFAQFITETSSNLVDWEPQGTPVFADLGVTTTMVTPNGSATSQFWRMRGPANRGLSPQAGIHAKTSYAITQARYRWTNRYQYVSGGGYFVHAFGYGDFNNDGNTDALVFPGQPLTLTPVPAQLTLNIDGMASDGSSVFLNAVSGALHPRKLLIGDLNGDSVDDAVLIDHGYDADPFPGAPLQVLLSAPGGKIETTIYTQYTGFHHAGALGDFDHDGDLDLFISNSTWQGTPHLILENDGHGAFTPTTQLVGHRWDEDVWSSEFFDLDGDGFLDLAVGGTTGTDPSIIYWGSSNGTYGSLELPLDLPTGWDVYDYDAEDIDNDGDRDLLVTLAGISGSNHQYKLFINHGNRLFVDETATRFDDPTYSGQWIDFSFVQDADSDTDLDIVADVWGSLVQWKNDGAGFFRRQP